MNHVDDYPPVRSKKIIVDDGNKENVRFKFYNLCLSTLIQLLFSFDQDMRVEKILIQTLACQLSSTLMQLLFSFDQDMRVEKTLIQTLACQLSSTLMQLLFSFDQDMRVEKTLIYKLSLVNSHQLLCNSCSCLTRSQNQRILAQRKV